MDVDDEIDRDLDSAGSAIQAFAPSGLWGLIAGGVLAAVVVAYGYLLRAWRSHRSGHSLS